MTGSGTALDPYVIWDVLDLQNMNLDLTAYYELGQNIDASATVGWNGGAGFIPVGNAITPFRGNFNGQGHSISTLFINRPGTDYVALFGGTNGATISNVTLENFTITGDNETAALAGEADSTSISSVTITGIILAGLSATGALVGQGWQVQITHCNSLGTVDGFTYVGGLIGAVWTGPSQITDCYSVGIVTALLPIADYIGGLIGYARDSTIQGSYSTTNVTARETIGGFVGEAHNVIIDTCYATGNIAGGTYTGGFIGDLHHGTTISDCYATGNLIDRFNAWGIGGFVGQARVAGAITRCYATGTIQISHNTDGVGGFAGGIGAGITVTISYSTGNVSNGVEYIGGFCGDNMGIIRNCYGTGDVSGSRYVGGFEGDNDTATAENCFSTGAVTGVLDVGGFCGLNNSTITNCFWDIETSGQTTSSGGVGKTTTEMKSLDTFLLTGWDIIARSIDKNNGYPYLAWQSTWYILVTPTPAPISVVTLAATEVR